MSVVLLNIDRFSRITKVCDPISKNEVLYQVMKVMRDYIRETDLLLRYKNNTYCQILKRVAIEEAQSISERIRRAVDNFYFNYQIVDSIISQLVLASLSRYQQTVLKLYSSVQLMR